MSKGLGKPRKGWFWRVLGAAVIGMFVGGFAGAAAGAISKAMQEFSRTSPQRPGPVEAELSQWTEECFVPFHNEIMTKFEKIKKLTPQNVSIFNGVLEELYAYKAYFE